MAHNAASRTKFMKYSNDSIGNRTRDFRLAIFSTNCTTASATVHRMLKNYSGSSTVNFWLGWQSFPWQIGGTLSGAVEYSCVLWCEAVCCLVNGFRHSEESRCARIQVLNSITRIGSCLWNNKALFSFETSEKAHPETQCHIAEDLTLLRHYSVRPVSLQLLCPVSNVNVAR
jgi:hypothetical protein